MIFLENFKGDPGFRYQNLASKKLQQTLPCRISSIASEIEEKPSVGQSKSFSLSVPENPSGIGAMSADIEPSTIASAWGVLFSSVATLPLCAFNEKERLPMLLPFVGNEAKEDFVSSLVESLVLAHA